MNYNVKKIRKEKGLTQKEVAQDSCMARSYLQTIENNVNGVNPSACALCRLAHTLDVPVGDLFDCD